MYIYIHTYIYICMYMYVAMHSIHICIQICTHVHTYIHTNLPCSRDRDAATYTSCVAVHCSVLQCCCNVYIPCHWRHKRRRHCNMHMNFECCSVLQCVAVLLQRLHTVPSVPQEAKSLQYACALCVLQCVAVCCSVLQCVAVCCSVLQCVAVCCSVLQCCCNVHVPCHRRRRRRRHYAAVSRTLRYAPVVLQ